MIWKRVFDVQNNLEGVVKIMQQEKSEESMENYYKNRKKLDNKNRLL